MTSIENSVSRITVVSDIRAVRDAVYEELRSASYGGIIDRFSFSNLQSSAITWSAQDIIVICAPPRDRVRLVQKTRQTHSIPKIGVLATSDADDDEFIAWAAIGICGYIEADAPVELVARTILRLVAGETIFPRRLSALLLHQFGRRQNNTTMNDAIESLTLRELAVLEMLDEGLSNKQIACGLAITSATVKNHVHNILTKLDVSSRGSAAAYVRRVAPSVATHVGLATITTTGRRGVQRELQSG